MGSSLDTNGIMKEIKLVEIHGYNLLLGEVTLKLDSDNPLNRFLHSTLKCRVSFLGIKLLCKLLGDGTTTSGTLLSEDTTLDYCTRERDKVNTGMLVETCILSSYKSLYHIRRNILVMCLNTVICTTAPCAKRLSVFTYNLRGIFVNRILHSLHVRHVTDPSIPDGGKGNCCCDNTQNKHYPKCINKFFAHHFRYLNAKIQ